MNNLSEEKNKKYIADKVRKALFYHTFWTISPLLAGCILLILSYDYSSIISFIDKGDLCLTSTAFFASAYFLYNENKPLISDKIDSILSVLCFPLIFILAFVYSKTFSHTLNADKGEINLYFIRIVSAIFLLASVYAFYRALKIDYLSKLRRPVDAKEEEKHDIQNILDQLPDGQ